MYLLDTNHCSLLIEGNAGLQEKMRQNAGAFVATCIFVEAELLFMAYNSQQQEANLVRVQAFLNAIRVYGADQQTARFYASLKADFLARYGPKEKSKRRRTRIEQLGVGENDLWIAAIALRHGLTVVSIDSDFLRLQSVTPFLLEDWSLG